MAKNSTQATVTSVKKIIAGCVVKPCVCVHEYQDERYGRHNRVHNLSGTKEGKSRCTVCGKEK